MDYDFLSASNGSGDAALMRIGSTRLIGGTTLVVDTIVNVPQKFIATSGTLGPDNKITAASKRDFKGHLDGVNVIIDGFMPGSVDAGNVAGQIVILKPNTHWTNQVATFIKNMKNLGTPEPITASTVTASSVAATGAVSGSSLTASGPVVAGNGLTVSAGAIAVPNNTINQLALKTPIALRVYQNGDLVVPSNSWQLLALNTVDGVNLGGWVADGNGWIVPATGVYQVSMLMTHQDNPDTSGNAQILGGFGTSINSTAPATPSFFARSAYQGNPSQVSNTRLWQLGAGTRIYQFTYAVANTNANYRFRAGNGIDGSTLELLYLGPNI